MAGIDETGHVVERLDVQSHPGDCRVVHQRLEALLDTHVGLIPQSQYVGDGHGSGLQGQVQTDIAALGNQRHALIDAPQALLVGPQRGPDDS